MKRDFFIQHWPEVCLAAAAMLAMLPAPAEAAFLTKTQGSATRSASFNNAGEVCLIASGVLLVGSNDRHTV